MFEHWVAGSAPRCARGAVVPWWVGEEVHVLTWKGDKQRLLLEVVAQCRRAAGIATPPSSPRTAWRALRPHMVPTLLVLSLLVAGLARLLAPLPEARRQVAVVEIGPDDHVDLAPLRDLDLEACRPLLKREGGPTSTTLLHHRVDFLGLAALTAQIAATGPRLVLLALALPPGRDHDGAAAACLASVLATGSPPVRIVDHEVAAALAGLPRAHMDVAVWELFGVLRGLPTARESAAVVAAGGEPLRVATFTAAPAPRRRGRSLIARRARRYLPTAPCAAASSA